jgi:ubiquinone/menaquinone biosynthesis C-methylase UbiE
MARSTDSTATHADGAVHERVQAQFGAAAEAYGTSPVHLDATALQRVVDLAQPKAGDAALDIATGAGHTALALGPHVARVIAYDLTQEMLRETRRNATARGLTNVYTQRGPAEKLPFRDASFDIVTSRQAPHHFADIRAAVSEMARVAKRGARVVVVDSTAPPGHESDPGLAAQWDAIERLRDPSHVRNYSPAEWRAMIECVGLRVFAEETGFATEYGGPMSFDAWTRRIKTPPEAVAELQRLFRGASPALAKGLRIEIRGEEIFFSVPVVTIAAIKEKA